MIRIILNKYGTLVIGTNLLLEYVDLDDGLYVADTSRDCVASRKYYNLFDNVWIQVTFQYYIYRLLKLNFILYAFLQKFDQVFDGNIFGFIS